MLYETHKHCPLVANFNEATQLQFYWLQLMAAQDIQYKFNIEHKLMGIAKGVGIEFRDNTNSMRQSNGFREQMKQKQRERLKGGE